MVSARAFALLGAATGTAATVLGALLELILSRSEALWPWSALFAVWQAG